MVLQLAVLYTFQQPISNSLLIGPSWRGFMSDCLINHSKIKSSPVSTLIKHKDSPLFFLQKEQNSFFLSNSSLSLKPRLGVDFVFPPSQSESESESPLLKFSTKHQLKASPGPHTSLQDYTKPNPTYKNKIYTNLYIEFGYPN